MFTLIWHHVRLIPISHENMQFDISCHDTQKPLAHMDQTYNFLCPQSMSGWQDQGKKCSRPWTILEHNISILSSPFGWGKGIINYVYHILIKSMWMVEPWLLSSALSLFSDLVWLSHQAASFNLYNYIHIVFYMSFCTCIRAHYCHVHNYS